MLSLEFRSQIGASWGDLAVDIRSMQVLDTTLGPVVLAVNGPAGGVLSFRLNEGLAEADLIDSVTYNTSMSYSVTGGSLLLEPEGGTMVAVLGCTAQDGTFGFSVSSDGQIGASTTIGLPDSASLTGPVMAVAQDGFVYTMNASAMLQCFAPNAQNGYVAGTSYADTDGLYLQSPVAMTTVRVSGQEYLLTLSGTEQGVSAFCIENDTGALSAGGSLGTASGLGLLANPTGMTTVEVGGHCYILVASSADNGAGGALSALELHDDGSLSVTDHLIDTLDTRFGRTHSLTSTQVGDWTYVLAGGGDAGLSLFTLTPQGQLIHLDSLADSLQSGLENITALTTLVRDDELDILVSSDKSAGLSRLAVSLADQGAVLSTESGLLNGTTKDDMLIAGAGNSDLRGGAGADILLDGEGQDTLSGGSGADLFVLRADEKRDVITDFDAAVDRLDLTAIPMLYEASRLSVTEKSWGAVLSFRGGEETELHSANGKTLTADQIFGAISWNANRPPMVAASVSPDDPAPDEPAQDNSHTFIGGPGGDSLFGTESNDTLRGNDGNDNLHGNAGADLIEGNAGADFIDGSDDNDWLDGGMHNDTLLGGHGVDTLYGSDGDDRLEGQDGVDLLYGGLGNDWMHGGSQNDLLMGGDGNDSLYGAYGNDRLEGEDGRDVLEGGQNNDWLDGGADDDWLLGGNMRDTLFGGLGNDSLEGQYGSDYIDGGLGDDWIHGGAMGDTIFGGGGNDTVNGGSGPDLVWLEDGDDLFRGFSQGGWLGRDTIWGGEGQDTIWANSGSDLAHGEGGDDLISGGFGGDFLYGDAGNDTLFGGFNNDVLFGGTGADWLEGGRGFDLLTGGADADIFAFDSLSGRNEITDFEPGVDHLLFDTIEKNFAALSVTNAPRGVWLEWDGGEVLLQGVWANGINASDVYFS
ncbi:calcium-binding protein [Thioclava sp. 15-R06ZXC-3]|uniref:Calcium-binding protein n=1 Tax=Thioclava arctica TaxID=3238301 RepID=A0ABV3TJJ0_9RHOB